AGPQFSFNGERHVGAAGVAAAVGPLGGAVPQHVDPMLSHFPRVIARPDFFGRQLPQVRARVGYSRTGGEDGGDRTPMVELAANADQRFVDATRVAGPGRGAGAVGRSPPPR